VVDLALSEKRIGMHMMGNGPKKQLGPIAGIVLLIVAGFSCRIFSGPETVTYRFSAEGNDCSGISYTWMTDLGFSADCHERFTGGDFLADCPVPKSVSEELKWPDNPTASISVPRSSDCTVHCEIRVSGELKDADEDSFIAYCEVD
jgi:hypothetical protein